MSWNVSSRTILGLGLGLLLTFVLPGCSQNSSEGDPGEIKIDPEVSQPAQDFSEEELSRIFAEIKIAGESPVEETISLMERTIHATNPPEEDDLEGLFEVDPPGCEKALMSSLVSTGVYLWPQATGFFPAEAGRINITLAAAPSSEAVIEYLTRLKTEITKCSNLELAIAEDGALTGKDQISAQITITAESFADTPAQNSTALVWRTKMDCGDSAHIACTDSSVEVVLLGQVGNTIVIVSGSDPDFTTSAKSDLLPLFSEAASRMKDAF